MNSAKLTQATLLALTMQNQAHKAAPLSTALMQGMVINRNIIAGETVGCYYNDSGELLRVADAPGYSTDYFVDEENLMYDFYNGRIRIRDGLSDTLIDDSVDAYEFKVVSGGACCAYKISSTENLWRFYFADGPSVDMTLPSSELDIVLGYRDGLICVCTSGTYVGVTPYILDRTGAVLSTLKNLSSTWGTFTAKIAVPLNASTAMVVVNVLTYVTSVDTVEYFTASTVDALEVWDGYTIYSYSYLGADQSYMYGLGRLSDGEDPPSALDDWVLIRWPLDYVGASETVEEYFTEPTFSPPPSQYGTIRMAQDGTAKLYEVSTMTQLYENDLPSVSSSGNVRENENYIWIPGNGVYQKVALGWLMYPTATYPRSEPYGKLGYAYRNAKIGSNGLAIVLFE